MLRGISKSQLWKGLEPQFLHSGLSLMALYQNPEFKEDQRNLFSIRIYDTFVGKASVLHKASFHHHYCLQSVTSLLTSK